MRKGSSKTLSLRRSTCPLACALDLVGDKWSLLIVRDLFFGKHRFSEFQASNEGITTNILSDRLVRMQRAGIVEKRLYEKRPPRYEYHLTAMGRGLGPVLDAYVTWSLENIPGTKGRDRR